MQKFVIIFHILNYMSNLSYCFFCFVIPIGPDEKYVLKIDDALNPTPDGVMAIAANNIRKDDEVFDSIYILSPTWGHIDDIKDDKVKARISADGQSILVTKPRIPVMFYGSKDVDETEELWTGENTPDENVKLAHLILANKIHEAEPESRMKTVKYIMPKDIFIKADPFNEWNEDGLIETRIVFTSYSDWVEDESKNLVQVVMHVPHIQWHVAIDCPSRLLKKKEKKNKAGSALQRAYLMSTPSKNMQIS
jgi:hypothetical protein